MNPEFIFIYVGIGLALVLLIAILVMQIVILKRIKKTEQAPARYPSGSMQQVTAAEGVVHCRSCGERMDSTERFCPKCGATRN